MTRMTHPSSYPYNARADERGKGEHLSYPSSRHSAPIRAKIPHPSYPSFAGMSMHDFREWTPELEAWIPQACTFLDRAYGGVSALHTAFCDWCIQHRSVPCTRVVFEQLLEHQGFHLCDSLVHSLLLKVDVAALAHTHDVTKSVVFSPEKSPQFSREEKSNSCK